MSSVQIMQYGGSATVGALNVPLEIVSPQVGSAGAVATGDTIDPTGQSVVRMAPTAAATGVVLKPGTYGGQRVSLINEATTTGYTVTFAASGTSNVAAGTSAVVAINSRLDLCWDPAQALWY